MFNCFSGVGYGHCFSKISMTYLVVLKITYFGLNPLLNDCNILLQIKYWLLIWIQNKLDSNCITQSFCLIVHINPRVRVRVRRRIILFASAIYHQAANTNQTHSYLCLLSIHKSIKRFIFFVIFFYICVIYHIEKNILPLITEQARLDEQIVESTSNVSK